MNFRTFWRDPLVAGAAMLVVVLTALGVLQYRWLREIADAQRARMRADASARAAAIAQDFDREVTRAFLLLQLDAETAASRDAARYAARFDDFKKRTQWPGLVRSIFLRESDATGGATLLRFSAETRRLEETDWPVELQVLREPIGLKGLAPAIVAGVPALLAPVAERMLGVAMTPGDLDKLPAQLGQFVVRRTHAQTETQRCTIVWLDRGVLTDRLLSDVVSKRLAAAAGPEYDASVVDANGGPIFGNATSGPGDAQAEMLRLRLDDIDSAILNSFVPEALQPAPKHERFSVRIVEGIAGGPHEMGGRWRLSLRHKSGSVDQAVRAALLRNLAVGFSVLGVLAGSVVLIAASARRVRALAARQMEFVASVSHELRTPLAVIRSAGENLADGVVSESSQVKRYGTLVRDEGLRLSQMVEQVLSFAGADARAAERRPVDLVELVERALLSETRAKTPALLVVPLSLPPVMGDAVALEQAVLNLVRNARKYGGEGVAVTIRVYGIPETSPREVAVRVTDKGPGLDPGERAQLFEPFFRGRRAREAQIPGSGLGLAIVRRVAESHGGRVEVESEPGKGASFAIVLPAAPTEPERAASDVQAHPAR